MVVEIESSVPKPAAIKGLKSEVSGKSISRCRLGVLTIFARRGEREAPINPLI